MSAIHQTDRILSGAPVGPGSFRVHTLFSTHESDFRIFLMQLPSVPVLNIRR